jgi:AraC family transcriptional regulator, transcriptional activator of pobA
MPKETIELVTLASSPFRLQIAPMSPLFNLEEEEEKASSAYTLHRHDYYSLFLLETGVIHFRINIEQVEMHPAQMLLLQPSQVHQCLHTENISGWVLFFDSKILDEKAGAALHQSIEKLALLHLDTEQLSTCNALLSLIFRFTQDKHTAPYQTHLLHSLINSLFYHMVNLLTLQEDNDDSKAASKPADITHRFKSLLKEYCLTDKRPAAYAARMNISVSHLNDTVKSVTGFSATYFIQQQLMGEAQRQLVYTSKSIKEIAFALGFQDYKYFIRLFTKVVTLSPSRFRALNQLKKLNTHEYKK